MESMKPVLKQVAVAAIQLKVNLFFSKTLALKLALFMIAPLTKKDLRRVQSARNFPVIFITTGETQVCLTKSTLIRLMTESNL